MNASSWRKAADLIAQGTQATQQIQAAATADSSQLESLPLSSLAADDSGPPQVNYGTEQPLTVSTPKAITTLAGEIQPTDTYRQIIPNCTQKLMLHCTLFMPFSKNRWHFNSSTTVL